METTGIIGIIWGLLGFYWDNGKGNGNYRGYRDYIGLIFIMTGSVEAIRVCPPAS